MKHLNNVFEILSKSVLFLEKNPFFVLPSPIIYSMEEEKNLLVLKINKMS